MGFGLLFLGFITFLSFKILPVGVLGTAIMYFGLSKLCGHAPYFKKAKVLSCVFFVYFAAFTALKVLNITGLFQKLTDTRQYLIWTVDELVYSILLFAFGYALMLSLKQICKQVGYAKGVNKYKLCSAFLNVFGVGALARFILYFTSYKGIVTAPVYLTEALFLFTMSAWIYSCYMMIATQEIIDDENAKIAKYDQKYGKNRKK